MKKLDKTDYCILDILQRNGRITNQELANQVALAPSSCLQRVRRLEEEGFIDGYHAHVNLRNVCRFVTCIATVKLRHHSYQELLAFKAMATSIPEIVDFYTVSGECDYILKIICRDMQAYLEINDRLISNSEYSATIQSHVVMEENRPTSYVDLDTIR